MKQKLLSLIFVLTCLVGVSFAQNRQVSGRVTSAGDGSPISGVSVAVVGTSNATQTDGDGHYSISVTGNDAVFAFSYVGYTSQRVNVGSRAVVNVVLTADEGTLEEVVVTAMGIQRQAKSLTYAQANVDPEDLVQNSEPDILKSMQGKVAGVDIRTSQGTPGAATRFQIRGNASFTGDNQPLIIVDGVPFDNSSVVTSNQTSGGTAYSSGIAMLDPNDIETMNILKGSAASALYGSRASNGVVLITTKSGSAKLNRPTSITFRSSVSLENIANLPKYQNLYGAGANFAYSNSNGSWGPAFRNLDSIAAWGPYIDAGIFAPGSKVPYQAYPNNVKDLFNTGVVYENSVGINGGTDVLGFNMTASMLDHQGYVPNSSYKRYNLSAGGTAKLYDRLTARANLTFANSGQIGGYFGENQVSGAASQFARSLFLARNWDVSLPWEDANGHNLNWLGAGQFDHPTWSAHNNFATTRENRILGSAGLDFEATDWLSFSYMLGTNISFLDRSERYEISSRAFEGNGALILDGRDHKELESTFLATFTPKINEDISLTGRIGHNYNQRVTDRVINEGRRFITPGIYSLKNTAQQIFDTDQVFKRRIMGVFAEANFGFRDYWFVQLVGRNDWSSTLPSNSRSYFYPGVSTSFVLTDALNMDSDILNYAKVRAAWAKVGRDTDPYMLQDVFLFGPNFQGQPTGRYDYTAYDPNLTPEFTNEVELGTELRLLKNRLTVDFTWYNKISTGLLARAGMPNSSGYDFLFTNFGKIRNRGVEISLGVKPLSPESPVQWSIDAAFTKNKNMVLDLMEGTDRIQLRGVLTGVSPYLEPGMPFGYIRGTKSMRDDEGNLLINPATGAMIEDPEEGMVGDPNPDFKLGINNRVSYKNFTLMALFDWTKGGDMYSVTNSSYLGRGVTRDTEGREYNAIIPGVYGDPITGQPILDGNGNKIQNQTRIAVNDLYFSPDPGVGQTFAINTATEWNMYDATVYRLREVSLGYELPQKLFANTFVKGLHFSVTGRNLWFFAPNFPKYANFDPEVNSFGSSTTQGFDLSAAPTTRRYGFNLVARF
ncbi:SusC/RagA family TonB-linked outer membrane protein [Sphingobacterium gobiense]|uniref:SusC/RagA family TonB-linked outer membrane protein n=1 Tax=Sphingobacterium gobiense TaxID=1382456 RepID=A0A2S9JEM4_9SPHI|nr:SusC/RagA family TonB-linked outer membrane protein [Sphingobacterium gobiense]PRD51357.1 SusC/RagA family TonB-linked outer membrane protein [Sphingobacterium gobiense]